MHSTESVAWVLFSLATMNLWHTWKDIANDRRDPVGIICAVWIFCYATVELCSVYWRGTWF